MKTFVLALLLLAACLVAPGAGATTGCERTASYDRCSVEEGPVCERVTIWIDHAQWERCGSPIPPLG